MRDVDLRRVLLARLEEQYGADPETRIIEELGVEHGAARADVAVVNGTLHGFEIKSEADTLDRLPNQVIAFSKVFEQMTLVVCKKHLGAALSIIPRWWGVILAQEDARGALVLRNRRASRRNPCANGVAVAELLWKSEILGILDSMSAAKGVRSKPREVLSGRLAAILPGERLFDLVRRRLRSREAWRTSPRAPARRT